MTPAFLRALAITLDFEGGYSNHPLDAGGPTYHGVTQGTYDAYRRRVGKPLQSVDLMTEIEEQVIFFEDYWTPCNCDALPEPLSHFVFDMAVNSGVWNAKITLQEALSVRQDGVIGPVTVATAKAMANVGLRFLKKRGAYVRDIIATKPAQVAFLDGWISRLLEQAWKGAQ